MAQTTICILGFQFHFGSYGKDCQTTLKDSKIGIVLSAVSLKESKKNMKKQNCLSFLPPLQSQTPPPAPPFPPSSCRPSPC